LFIFEIVPRWRWRLGILCHLPCMVRFDVGGRRRGGCFVSMRSGRHARWCVHSALRWFASWLTRSVVVVVVALGSTDAAFAQSFLDTLFGGGQPPRAVVPPSQRLGSGGVVVPPRTSVVQVERAENAEPDRPRDRVRGERDITDDGASYQTMCVRTCDGYYWPVAYPAKRSDFKRDASVCRATCGAETRLYSRSGPGDDAEAMRDADGVSYGSTETAFAYRKGLINGCSCKPMPWSDGEQARHEGYVLAQAEAELRAAQVEADRVAAAQAAADALSAKVAGLEMVSPIEGTSDQIKVAESAVGVAVPQVEWAGDAGKSKSVRGKPKREVAFGEVMLKPKRGAPVAARAVQLVTAQAKPQSAGATGWLSPAAGNYRYPGD
jgi:hypothetical protein